ncbi:hypothetical protein SUGI_0673540 [Cryptomeria japonica]|nr:hypothetical protein SUGI_0673540 [Cryptomeria japonica]
MRTTFLCLIGGFSLRINGPRVECCFAYNGILFCIDRWTHREGAGFQGFQICASIRRVGYHMHLYCYCFKRIQLPPLSKVSKNINMRNIKRLLGPEPSSTTWAALEEIKVEGFTKPLYLAEQALDHYLVGSLEWNGMADQRCQMKETLNEISWGRSLGDQEGVERNVPRAQVPSGSLSYR